MAAADFRANCCTTGVKHEGDAKGEFKTVGGVETYLTYPPSRSTTVAILIFTDVIGHRFLNAQLIADQFAAQGYFTVMPDLFHGDPVPLNKPGGFDLMKWLSGPPGHEPERVQPVVESVIKVLRTEMGVERLGGVGYCFGGKYVILNLKGPSALDVGFIAHPSFVESSEVRAIAGPLSIAAAETDTIFPAEKRRETEDILAGAEVQQPHQMTLYGGVEHGFAVRGDVAKKEVRFAKESAFHQAVRWFDEFLHLS